jgi:hypothetical protein
VAGLHRLKSYLTLFAFSIGNLSLLVNMDGTRAYAMLPAGLGLIGLATRHSARWAGRA